MSLPKRILKRVIDCFRTHDVVDFEAFQLHIDPRDGGGRSYRDPNYRAELLCPLHREIVSSLRPATYIDVGANYGFTALVHGFLNPEALVVAVEPSPKLLPYLRRNLAQKTVGRSLVVDAICSDEINNSAGFALNPNSSQDNRVMGEAGWRVTKVHSITLDSLVATRGFSGPFFIKIDTQGFEERVLRGGRAFLRTRTDWLIKMEFAPKWLLDQGTDPALFLQSLSGEFRVSEWPRRTRYIGDDLGVQDSAVIAPEFATAMVDHVKRLAAGAGWVDLLIRPKKV